MSEDVEEIGELEEMAEESAEELIVEVPVAESGNYLYVCSECGSDLVEIPYYNRFYCEHCRLHY